MRLLRIGQRVINLAQLVEARFSGNCAELFMAVQLANIDRNGSEMVPYLITLSGTEAVLFRQYLEVMADELHTPIR